MRLIEKLIFLILVIVMISGCAPKTLSSPHSSNIDDSFQEPTNIQSPPQNEPMQTNVKTISDSLWTYGGQAIAGKYADAEIIEVGNGNYRIYYSAEPEVPGFNGQVYSAVTSDGKNWKIESGERKISATFPSVIKLNNGKYRMYFQDAGGIKSALSDDGLTFSDESGIRIDASNGFGLNLENVAAPTVIKEGNDYIMVYRGTINEEYSKEKVPNSNTQLFLWATSTDGLNFEKKGIALDSRNGEFYGLLDGPEFVKWDDGTLRLYFWSYAGVFHVTYNNGIFSETIFDYTINEDTMNKFPQNPPADPTIAKVNGNWFLYYGQHAKGIYYAKFNE